MRAVGNSGVGWWVGRFFCFGCFLNTRIFLAGSCSMRVASTFALATSGEPTLISPSLSTSSTSPSSTLEPTSPENFSSRIVCPGVTLYRLPPDRITAYIVLSSSVKANNHSSGPVLEVSTALFRLGMCFVVFGAEMFKAHVGVLFRGSETGVAEEFLNGTKVGASFEQVSRESVPQGMGGQPPA